MLPVSLNWLPGAQGLWLAISSGDTYQSASEDMKRAHCKRAPFHSSDSAAGSLCFYLNNF